ERVLALIEKEQVTLAAGVPTIWIGSLPILQAGKYDISSTTRIVVGGSAAPRSLIEAYDKLGLNILHAWGMTELTPIGTVSRVRKELLSEPASVQLDYRARQGMAAPGVELRALDAEGNDVPWDGTTMGELVVR